MHTCQDDTQTDVGGHKETNRAETKRIYTASVTGTLLGDRQKKRAAAGVKRPTGPAGRVKHLTHIREAKQDVKTPSC